MSKDNKYSRNGRAIANKDVEEKYLISLFDSLVIAKDFTYGEFNNVLPFGPDVVSLREAEEQYPELGIAKWGTVEEGVSTLSLLATVTAVFCGKRLGVLLQKDSADETPLDEKLILGFTLLNRRELEEETKETEFTSSDKDDKKDVEIKETEKTEGKEEETWEVDQTERSWIEAQIEEPLPEVSPPIPDEVA